MYKKLLSSIITIVLFCTTYGQEKPKNWRLQIWLKEQNVGFTMPKGYLEHNAGFNYDCWDSRNADGLVYSIINKDSSILIAVSFNPYPSKSDLIKNNWWYDKHPPDSNYVKHIKALADTVNAKIISYPKRAKKANAETCTSFSRNCKIKVLGRYPYNRFMLFAKKGRGHFSIVYFYTESAKASIEKEVDRTVGMLKFE